MIDPSRKITASAVAGAIVSGIAFFVDRLDEGALRRVAVMGLPWASVLLIPVCAWGLWKIKTSWADMLYNSTSKVAKQRAEDVDQNANKILQDPFASEEAKREASERKQNALLQNLRLSSNHHASAFNDLLMLQGDTDEEDSRNKPPGT